MFRTIQIRIVVLLAALLLLNQCYLVSDFIIGGEAAVFVDEHLPGLWRFPGKPGLMLIARHKSGEYSLHYFNTNFELDAEYFAGRLSKAGGKTFMNLRRYAALAEKASDTGYIPLHYDLNGNQLKIALFETRFFNDAIAAKKLTGQVPRQSSTYATAPTRITSRGEDFARFILESWNNPAMLEKPQAMERIRVDLPATGETPPAETTPPRAP